MRKTCLSNDVLIRAPQQRHAATIVALAVGLAGWASLIVVNFTESLWKGVGSAVLSLLIGHAAIAIFKKQHAYRAGWLDGRWELRQAALDAADRDRLTAGWIRAEADLDRQMQERYRS